MNKKSLIRIDNSEMEARILAGGILPKGMKKNMAFYLLYGSKKAAHKLFNHAGRHIFLQEE